MAKSKRKRSKGAPQREKFDWSDTEVAYLLAWADRCVVLEEEFEDTVTQQLRQKWPERDYRYNVIENKMKRLWDRMGYDGTNRQDIFTKGTQCLDLDLFKDKEQKAFDEFKSELLGSEKQLRSGSTSTAISPRVEPAHTFAERPIIATLPVRVQDDSQAHSEIESERGYRRSPRIEKRRSSSQLPTALSNKKIRSSSKRSTRLYTELSNSDDNDAQPRSTAKIFLDRPGSPKKIGNRRDNSIDGTDAFNRLLEERNASILYAESRISTLEKAIADRDNSVSKLREENETLLKSKMRLSNQISRLSREVTDCKTNLKDRADCSKVAARYSETDQKKAIEENEMTITHLKRQLYECKKIALLEPRPHISHREIDSTIGYIEDCAKTWSHRTNITFPHSLIGSGLDQKLADIVRLNPSFLPATAAIEEQIVELANDVGSINVFRALTATALREWVFESDFCDFDAQESELLAMYRRKLLMQKDGPRLVRTLDFSATESLFMNEQFQEHVLVDKSKELTTRFLEPLAPFLPHTSPDSVMSEIATGDENDEDNIVLLGRMLFLKALKLKADLMLTTNLYETRMFEPGTQFNPTYMLAERKDGSRLTGLNKKIDRKVKLCLFPALYSYAAKPLPETDWVDVGNVNISEIVVQCRNFLSRGDDRSQDGGVLLGKAIVLLED